MGFFWLTFDEIQLTFFHLCACHASVSTAEVSTWTNFPPATSSEHLVFFSLALQVPFRTVSSLFHSLHSGRYRNPLSYFLSMPGPQGVWIYKGSSLQPPAQLPVLSYNGNQVLVLGYRSTEVIDMRIFRMGEEGEILGKTWSATALQSILSMWGVVCPGERKKEGKLDKPPCKHAKDKLLG